MNGLLDLSGMCAVVTGGSRGVGKATALMLGRAGANVGIAYRSRAGEAASVVEALEAMGVQAWSHAGDLSDPAAVESLFAESDRRFPGLDIVVVNHGIWPVDDEAISSMSDARWHRTVDANLHSVFYVCRAAARRICDNGRIVLVGSTAGQRGEAFHADYAATKGAMISLVKGFCIELAPRGITVNCVAPGWIDTEMAAPAFAGSARAAVESGIPIGRVASPDDIAGPIAFLCSPLARHITGEILNVNGGAVLVG